MELLAILVLAVVLYYVVNLLLWFVLDCNVQLWLKTTFGTPISSMRGQVVWITGTSSGIGRSLAVNLASHGVRLALSARRKALLDEVREECLQRAHGLLTEKDILVLPMDMLDYDTHEKCVNQVVSHFGHLDVLVNNAGRSQRADWEKIELQVDRDLFELDVFAVLHLTRLVVKYFLRERDGHGYVAATSSVGSFLTAPFSASYCAAKRALNAYLQTLHVEHRDIGISLFCPGPVATDFLKEAFTEAAEQKLGQSSANQKRMTSERCGYLFATALANKLEFTWCGLYPVNFLAYCASTPALTKLTQKMLSKETMMKIRDGKL